MITIDAPAQIDLLGIDILDVRATIEAMHRCVIKAQANVDQYRHTSDRGSIDLIASCLDRLDKEGAILTASIARARQLLAAVADIR